MMTTVKHVVFLGLAVVDILYDVDYPRENTKNVARRQEVLCGGPAANAAITCAFLGQPAVLVTALGSHPLAKMIHRELDELGVLVVDMAPELREMPSVSSVLVSAGGSRTVISGHATRPLISADAFNMAALESAGILLLDGHHMECAIRAAGEAKRRGIPVVLDGGSWKAGTDELLAYTSIAICSEDFRAPDGSEATDYVLANGPDAVAITRGAEPITWATHDERGELSVPQIAAVDTTGAGDIFHGAFCYRLMKSANFQRSLQFAAEVASESCRFFGTRDWMENYTLRATRNP